MVLSAMTQNFAKKIDFFKKFLSVFEVVFISVSKNLSYDRSQ